MRPLTPILSLTSPLSLSSLLILLPRCSGFLCQLPSPPPWLSWVRAGLVRCSACFQCGGVSLLPRLQLLYLCEHTCRKLGQGHQIVILPGRIAQLVTCLATDVRLTADPGVASAIPAWSHVFVEIDHEIISMVILLPSADSFKKSCCQLQAKVCAQITG